MGIDFIEISFVGQFLFLNYIEDVEVGNGHFWLQDPSWGGRTASSSARLTSPWDRVDLPKFFSLICKVQK